MPFSGSDYCMSPRELLRPLKDKKLSFSNYVNPKINKSTKIVTEFMKLVLDDIVNNGVSYRLNASGEAYLRIDGIYDEDFIKAKQNGAFQEVDPFKSNLTGHKMYLVYKGVRKQKKIPVTVDSRLKEIITNKTNDGYKY